MLAVHISVPVRGWEIASLVPFPAFLFFLLSEEKDKNLCGTIRNGAGQEQGATSNSPLPNVVTISLVWPWRDGVIAKEFQGYDQMPKEVSPKSSQNWQAVTETLANSSHLFHITSSLLGIIAWHIWLSSLWQLQKGKVKNLLSQGHPFSKNQISLIDHAESVNAYGHRPKKERSIALFSHKVSVPSFFLLSTAYWIGEKWNWNLFQHVTNQPTNQLNGCKCWFKTVGLVIQTQTIHMYVHLCTHAHIQTSNTWCYLNFQWYMKKLNYTDSEGEIFLSYIVNFSCPHFFNIKCYL